MTTLNKLTQRAKDVLLGLSKNETATSGYIVDALSASSGISALLLQALPQLKLDRSKNISIKSLVKEAYYQALKMDHSYVGTEHLLLALLKFVDPSDYDAVKVELVKLNVFPNALKTIEKSKKTPMLESFGVNINHKLFKEIDKPILFREEYKSLISVLLQKNNFNALLIGDKGVGKRSLVEFLAQNINYLDVPPSLIGYQVIELDLLSFMTNAFNKNSLEFVLAGFAEELRSLGRIILYIRTFKISFCFQRGIYRAHVLLDV
jgi:ATP-dependent Clp protease ATP-binding subunit ClpA